MEVGSAMYKEGVRWTESMQTFGKPDIRSQSMVLDYILTISMIILMVFMMTIIITTYGCPPRSKSVVFLTLFKRGGEVKPMFNNFGANFV